MGGVIEILIISICIIIGGVILSLLANTNEEEVVRWERLEGLETRQTK
jgi:hypothetical protein